MARGFYDPVLGRWFTPDPAEQFANPYLAMGCNPVVYVDPNGEFIFLATGIVVTLAAATTTTTAITTAVIVGVAIAAAATAVALASAAAAPALAIPPDGYLWDPLNPDQLIWQSFKGRSEGLDYIKNVRTGEVYVRSMHTEWAKIRPIADLPAKFSSLNTYTDPRITYIMTRMNSIPAGAIHSSYTAAELQTGISAFGHTSAFVAGGSGLSISPGGPALILSGLPLVPKSGGLGAGGASGRWTSMASKALRSSDRVVQRSLGTSAKLPAKSFLARYFATRGIGAVAGRAVPYIGWTWTAWDLSYELGKYYGPSTWYGYDNTRYFR